MSDVWIRLLISFYIIFSVYFYFHSSFIYYYFYILPCTHTHINRFPNFFAFLSSDLSPSIHPSIHPSISPSTSPVLLKQPRIYSDLFLLEFSFPFLCILTSLPPSLPPSFSSYLHPTHFEHLSQSFPSFFPPTFTHSPIHSLTHSLTHPFTHSLTHSLIHSVFLIYLVLNSSFYQSLPLPPSLPFLPILPLSSFLCPLTHNRRTIS